MNTIARTVSLVALGCTALTSVALADPMITNGSFEAIALSSPFQSGNPADIPGWTHTGPVGDDLLWAVGYVDGGGSITVAGDGNQFVTLGEGFDNFSAGTPHWTTTITGLTPGSVYQLSFMIANEGGDTGGLSESMSVGFDSGSSTVAQSFTAPTNGLNYWRFWLPETLDFLATDTSAVVDFSTTNQPFDMGLDAVSVGSVPNPPAPEPGTFLVLGVGLSALGFARRRV